MLRRSSCVSLSQPSRSRLFLNKAPGSQAAQRHSAMFDGQYIADELENQERQRQLEIDSFNWKDCIHRWKRSREKWRSQALRLQQAMCEAANTVNHWRQRSSLAQSELTRARGQLNDWHQETMRCRDTARQWKCEALRWRELARAWKQRCCDLLEQKDDQQIAQLCQARQKQCAEIRQMYRAGWCNL